MKKGFTFLTLLMGVMVAVPVALVTTSCGQPAPEPVTYSVAINNKGDFADWSCKQAGRSLKLTISPNGNVTQLVKDGEIVVTSSNTDVLTVSGLMLTPVGVAGEATVTVKYHDATDTVAITLVEGNPEPAHKVLKPSEANADLTTSNAKSVLYEITGYVIAWQSGNADAGDYGNYYLADTIDETDTSKCAYVYGSCADNEIVWNGAEYEDVVSTKTFRTHELTKGVTIKSKVSVLTYGKFYNTTKEFVGKVTAVDNSEVGDEVPEPATQEKTLEEIWALTDGKPSIQYKTSFIVKEFSDNKGNKVDTASEYGNMNVTSLDGNTTAFCWGATATTTARVWNKLDAYGFTNPKDFLTNDMTKDIMPGDTCEALVCRADYNTTKEITAIITKVTKGEAKPCTDLVLDKDYVELRINGSSKITATPTPSDTTDKVVWTSDDETVATVDAGVVTGVGPGIAKITATCGNVVKQANAVVYTEAEHGTTESDPLTVDESIDASLALGPNTDDTKGSTDYYVTGQISEITYKWSESSANLSFNMWVGGRYIQAYKAGADTGVTGSEIAVGDTIVIKGKLENYKGKAELQQGCKVISRTAGSLVAATGVTVNPATMSLDVREEMELLSATAVATVTPSTCTEVLNWTTGDPTIASVTNPVSSVTTEAVVTAVGKGSTKITATIGNVKTDVDVTVNGASIVGPEAGTVITHNFGEHEDFNDSTKWSSSYADHTLSYEYDSVVFVKANHQASGQAINDCPVSRGGDVTLKLKDNIKISSVTFTCKQWNTKGQKFDLFVSSDNGVTWGNAIVTDDADFTVEATNLTNINAVRLVGKTTDNQVGFVSVSYTVA